MRTIAITKKCTESEKEFILASVEQDDRVLFFDNESELLNSEDCAKIEIVLGEPAHSTIRSMKNLRWIQMTWAGANKYTSVPGFSHYTESCFRIVHKCKTVAGTRFRVMIH